MLSKNHPLEIFNITTGIKKLELMLDPAKSYERDKEVMDAKNKFDEHFKDSDMKKAYMALFEILWYSKLPCFDILADS